MVMFQQDVLMVQLKFSNSKFLKVNRNCSFSKLIVRLVGDARTRGVAGQAQLTKNQTLEGHLNEISSIAWNQRFGKLTTADVNGTVIVWVDGPANEFVQDMLNNRTKNRISDMKWNSTQVYEEKD